MNATAMAFTFTSVVHHAMTSGHYRCLCDCGNRENGLILRNSKKRSTSICFVPELSPSSVIEWNQRPYNRLRVSASTDEDAKQEEKLDSSEESKYDSEKDAPLDISDNTSVSSRPFVGRKISSRIAARTAEVKTMPAPLTISVPSTPAPASPFQQNSKPPFSQETFTPRISLDRQKLKSARPTVFTDGDSRSRGTVSKSLVEAIKQSEREGKTTKFGEPIVPKNLFDDLERIPSDEMKIDFSLNRGQFVIILSFLIIISIMLGTTFFVWKVGGIHFNEY
eukprot:c18270_g1_i1 orf=248-1084(+)